MNSPSPAALEVLAARASELARPLDQEHSATTLDLLLVAVSGQPVGFDVTAVREVLPPRAVAQVPGNTGILAGVVVSHGDVLAVTALAALLGLPVAVPAHEQWVIVLDHPRAPLGLLADAAVDVVSVDPAELSAPSDPDGLTRALLPGGGLVLDSTALLDDPRLSLARPDHTEELPWHET